MRQMLAAIVALLLLSSAAGAQAPRQSPGEEVIVTQSASGQEIRGRIVELSSTTLAMLVNGQRVDVPLEQVLRIEGRHDSVKNGAAIGALVGGGLIVLACGGEIVSDFCLTAGVFYTGIGALAGAGVDALHRGRTTIYSKPSPVSVAIAPAGKGARAQVRVSW